MGRLLGLICGLLLQGCCLFGAGDAASTTTEAESAMSGAAGAAGAPSLTGEAARAVAVAADCVAAYRSGDSAAVLELTDPGQRARGYEKSMEKDVKGIGPALGAVIEGDWAIVGFPFDYDGQPEVFMFIMHRSEERWYVGSSFVSGLTEVFNAFSDYPDPPSPMLHYMPARQFTSRLWSQEASIPAVRLDAPVDVAIDEAQKEKGALLKFSVKGRARVRITATTAEDASPTLEFQAPEGGKRASGSQSRKSRQDRYSEGPREALIEHGMWDGTYLLRVRAKKAATVRLQIESLPLTPPEK